MKLNNTESEVDGHQRKQTDNLYELSVNISSAVETYLGRLDAVGAERPTLDDPFPELIHDEGAQLARLRILRLCERLMALVQGPVQWLMFQTMSFIDPACVGAILDMGIHEIIAPGPEPTSLDEIVEATGASKDILKRVMRVCTQRLVFDEIAPEQFVHNGVSMQFLAPPVQALISHACDDGLRIASRFSDALKKTNLKGSDRPQDTAFSLAFETNKGLFDYFYTEDIARGQRFGLGMAGSEIMKSLTEDMYPFDSLPHGATVVDVGGSRGHVSVRIAEKIPGLNFVVQDDAAILEAGQAEGIPSAVKERIEFMPHDFFKEQPVKGADAYLLRFILHDHPDSVCAKILSHIVDVMDPEKSRILIDDAIVPSFLGPESSRFFNLLDLYMLFSLNGKERTLEHWNQLIKMVSPRLVLEKIWKKPGSGPESGTVLELRLRAEEVNSAHDQQ
ncbi:O-methyltransferase xanE [Aspergillus clavatus NRRL 1]|uniref:O-methyltransferase, putative n=1 Tax=Aspergillus clavatus (strain ATCC 1007 / CBS 513.65 / DSM 816 / NCTC 3887 / NRRL 1 / QM 1276 / 107) TaxID=344612 RepID=A1C573_ASPCL|nr:O-methyltransferase, putative [Aspergillus clavatus NRRL 1]EAW14841.1 O-methyltransferase, putative [Aspergillus clavatus NRRL 1]